MIFSLQLNPVTPELLQEQFLPRPIAIVPPSTPSSTDRNWGIVISHFARACEESYREDRAERYDVEGRESDGDGARDARVS